MPRPPSCSLAQQIRDGVAPDRRISIEDPRDASRPQEQEPNDQGLQDALAADLDTNLIIACALTLANKPEADALPAIVDDLARFPRAQHHRVAPHRSRLPRERCRPRPLVRRSADRFKALALPTRRAVRQERLQARSPTAHDHVPGWAHGEDRARHRRAFSSGDVRRMPDALAVHRRRAGPWTCGATGGSASPR